MSLEKALFDVRKACQKLGFAIGAAWRRFVADIARRAGRRDPVVGFDLGAPGGDATVIGRFKADEIAKAFGVPLSLLCSVQPMPRLDLLARRRTFAAARIMATYSTYRRSYSYRVWRELGALGKKVNAPSGKVRPCVARRMQKLQRYAVRGMSGQG